jgi:hypothetical protein
VQHAIGVNPEDVDEDQVGCRHVEQQGEAMATLNSWFKKQHERRKDPTSAAIRALMKRGIEHKRAVAIAVEQKKVSEHLQNEQNSYTVNLRSETREQSTEPSGSGPTEQDAKV